MARKRQRYTVTDGKLVLTLALAAEGGYVVTSPFNPGLNTEAETLEAAFEMARDAIAELKRARAKPVRPAVTRRGG